MTNKESSPEEQFQNKVLRPILKLQHDLFVAYFTHYIHVKKRNFSALTELEKNEFIDFAFHKDNLFKSELKGIIIGQYSPEEFSLYTKNTKEYNKRILTMIRQRILSVIDVF